MAGATEVGRLRAVWESIGADKVKSEITGVQAAMSKTGDTAGKTSTQMVTGSDKAATAVKQVGSGATDAAAKLTSIGTSGQNAGQKAAAAAMQAVDGTKQVSSSAADTSTAVGGIGNAFTSIRTRASEAVTAAKVKFSELNSTLTENREVAGTVATTLGTLGAVGATALVGIVKTTMTFDSAMSEVQADTHETAENMNALREAAVAAGADTAFSATEAAQGIDELAKAGVSTSDILSGGLSGALSLAAAGSVSVGDAAETAASAITMFGLSGSDVGHVADLLAAGAGKAQGSVGDLSAALNNVGTVASNTGLSIEETTGFLSAMASYGLTGAEAGTQLKSMLQSLQAPSSTAKAALDELGLSLYDNAGNTKSLTQFVGEYQASLEGKTQAEKDSYNATIFGSYGINAANVAYKEGADGIQEWIDKVDDSGYAAKTAADKQDNLAGDLEKLGGAFSTLAINMGEGLTGPLRFLTQGITGLVDGLGALPAPLQQGAALLLAGGTGVALLGTAYVLALPKIAAFKTAQDQLNVSLLKGKTSSEKFRSAVSLIGKSAGVTAVLGALAAGASQAAQDVELSTDALAQFNSQTKGLDFDSVNAQFSGLGVGLDGLSESLDSFYNSSWWQRQDLSQSIAYGFDSITMGAIGASDGFDEAKGKLSALNDQFAELGTNDATDKFRELADAMGGGEEKYSQLLKALPDYKAALIEQAEAAGQATDDQSLLNYLMGDTKWDEATDSADGTATAIDGVSDSASNAADQISDLSDQIEAFGETTLDARQAQRDFEQALDDAQDALAENGRTLDISTEAGRKNQDALDGIAESTTKLATAKLAETQSVDDANAMLEQGRQQYVSMATAMGMSEEDAKALANTVITSSDAMNSALADLNMVVIGDKVFTVNDDGSIDATEKNLTALAGQIDATPDHTVTISEPMSAGIISALETLGYKVTSLPDGQTTITATDNATSTADAVKKAIDSIPNKKTIMFNMLKAGGEDGLWVTKKANGGMVSYFANGGENHVAQVAPAGAWRVWAEPETGGEAYIPLAASKRARSLAVTEAVAGMFGYDLVPHGTKRVAFADGGTVGAANTVAAQATPSVDQSTHIIVQGNIEADAVDVLFRKVRLAKIKDVIR